MVGLVHCAQDTNGANDQHAIKSALKVSDCLFILNANVKKAKESMFFICQFMTLYIYGLIRHTASQVMPP